MPQKFACKWGMGPSKRQDTIEGRGRGPEHCPCQKVAFPLAFILHDEAATLLQLLKPLDWRRQATLGIFELEDKMPCPNKAT